MAFRNSGLFELHAVVTVATHNNFRRAARELDMSPSALSHAIATLEQRLGVRLFNRTTRSVSLSQAGEQFLSRVGPALHEISGAMEDVNALRDTPSGLLRLNASERAAARIAPVVLAFLERYPDMSVDLVSEGRNIDIVAEGFDLGLRLAEVVPQDMVAVPFGPEISWAVVGAPDYFKANPPPRSPADLAAHNCIRRRLPSGLLYRWEFEVRGEEIAVDVPGRLTLNNDALMLTAALAGAGLAYISDAVVAQPIAEGRLVRVLADFTPPYPGLCLYYPPHRQMRAGLRTFIDFVKQQQRSLLS
ncbi:MAG: LysR family transcriptional regulator [Asticcacaulis sp.]|uniref:LysR family transcriptional regulator n=1 Tax=Asticcacaulis sp. TaxID=1872648 RepID=UPI0039E37A63